MQHISVLPILVATALNIVISMVWYSPSLLGQPWAAGLKLEMGQLKATSWEYTGAISISLITALVTAVFTQMLNIQTVDEAIKLALLVWVGFIVTHQFSAVLWARKPMKVYFIEIGHLLVITLVNTLIFTLWK